MNDQHTSGSARVTVMTGATSGIGEYALQHLAAEPGARIIIGARGRDRQVPVGVQAVPLDLASLQSVRDFAAEVEERLDGDRIDALVLNAGTQSGESNRTSEDGFELTYAVNHLAHYLLVRLLLPLVADGGRIVITTSETHDPEVTPLAPKGFEPEVWAHPRESGFGSGMRAYGASNLGRMQTALSLATSPEAAERGITVVAFSPGLTGGTGLGRSSSPVAKALVGFMMHTVFRIVGLFKPEYVIGKPERAGEVLSEVAAGRITPPPGRVYMNLIKGQPNYPSPSKTAMDQAARDRMWRETAALVGLADQTA